MKRLATDIIAFLVALGFVVWLFQYLALREDVEVLQQEQLQGDSQ